jgi:hypothetical protein
MSKTMGLSRLTLVAVLAWTCGVGHVTARAQTRDMARVTAVAAPHESARAATSAERAYEQVANRRGDDLAALATYRPGFPFWRHVFSIPDGSIAFGSAIDGRLLAVLPAKGDWLRDGTWTEPGLRSLLDGHVLARKLNDRRDQVAALLAPVTGPIVHNPTRGGFVRPNAQRYGGFLDEWSRIYERFGVPADIGLAQALIESGLNPTRRSPARAVGFCQWLAKNWKRLDAISPDVIESANQTTQAGYCAAYVTILATKYGSFIPALSEHHSGGTNVGRTLISGARLNGADVRDRYFLGSQFARDLRQISLYGYRDLYRTYGPRSYAYAEMVFGNTFTIDSLRASMRQEQIYAMRATRRIPVADIARRTHLSTAEIRRFNPALIKAVPPGGTLYLPVYVKEFGRDVAYWHREPTAAFGDVLNDFVHLNATETDWDDPAFEPVLRRLQQRFRDTGTEEGSVMATVLSYAIDESMNSGRGEILAEYRASEKVKALFARGLAEREAARGELALMPWRGDEDAADVGAGDDDAPETR